MPETIITKRCCTCKQFKEFSRFSKNQSREDGLNARCKMCDKAYCQTDRVKAIKKRYSQTEKYKNNQAVYEKSKAGRIAQKRYRKNNPEKIKAKDAVNQAVRYGKLPLANTFKCKCGEQGRDYHHYAGYAKKHWFDVIILCRICHKELHKLYA